MGVPTPEEILVFERIRETIREGRWWEDISIAMSFCTGANLTVGQVRHIKDAMLHKSLDAARAFHDSLLPGWYWSVTSDSTAEVENIGDFGAVSPAYAQHPAQAWVLAVIDGYINQES